MKVVHGQANNWAVHKTFFNRRPTLVNLVQKDPRTSLQIFDHTNERAMIPEKVMIDSGARVFILISPAIAKTMNLTVVPGTSPIQGIGGHGGSSGRTKEFIFLRLGGCEAGEVNEDPCTGCFTLKVKPIVMTEMAVQSIGHHVLLGQGFPSVLSWDGRSPHREVSLLSRMVVQCLPRFQSIRSMYNVIRRSRTSPRLLGNVRRPGCRRLVRRHCLQVQS
jgi:hypothetical protein